MHANGVATRAITIDAPASAVWPWIAQRWAFPPAAGPITYDRIEDMLGLSMHSSETVLPENQHPQVREGFGHGTNKMSFKIVEPEHVLATHPGRLSSQHAEGAGHPYRSSVGDRVT